MVPRRETAAFVVVLGLLHWALYAWLDPEANWMLRGPAGRDLRIPAALAVGPHLLYLATWNCTSGVPGDWDLFAVSGLVFGWFAAEAAGRLPRSHPARRVLGPVAVSLGAALTLCFLLANAATRAPVVP